MKHVISSPKAPAAVGPYSQAIELNGTVFVSGQLPIDPAKGEIMNNAYAQFFPDSKPARVCYQVSALPKGAKVEIDAIAGK